ncbi:hypothetical protein JRO89_XS06G0225300 [Xanthoceras sorbifolium]|uniref:Sulfiredoxin n=1 Tax=Xanthoceras sorbifolium TaxID=99658 RepID=A0ABQ8HZ56_9ROSI|nr:hypothetical protein JRO89_XS06G0225300 [Xanthoceras sorbifolium]
MSAFTGSSPGSRSNSATGGPVIVELPLEKIKRPLIRTSDPKKVKELMDSIQKIGLEVPVDVIEVDGVYYGTCSSESSLKCYYTYSFFLFNFCFTCIGLSGCHRYEAHQRLGLLKIRCKVRHGTKETLRHYLR